MSTNFPAGRALLTAAAVGLLLLLPALAPGAHAAGASKAFFSVTVPNYSQNANKIWVLTRPQPKNVRVSVSTVDCGDGAFFNTTNTNNGVPFSRWEVSFSTKCITAGATVVVEVTDAAENLPDALIIRFYNGDTSLGDLTLDDRTCALEPPPTDTPTPPGGGGGAAAGGSGCPVTLGGVADYPDLSSGPNAALVGAGAAAAGALAFALGGAAWHARRRRSR